MTCLSDESKLIMEQKPDIIEGVRLLKEHLSDNVEFQGLLFIYYEPNIIDNDNISTTMFGNYSSSELSVILATQMNTDPALKEAILNAVKINKSLANG